MRIEYKVFVQNKEVVNGDKLDQASEDWRAVLEKLVIVLREQYGTWATINLSINWE